MDHALQERRGGTADGGTASPDRGAEIGGSESQKFGPQRLAFEDEVRRINALTSLPGDEKIRQINALFRLRTQKSRVKQRPSQHFKKVRCMCHPLPTDIGRGLGSPTASGKLPKKPENPGGAAGSSSLWSESEAPPCSDSGAVADVRAPENVISASETIPASSAAQESGGAGFDQDSKVGDMPERWKAEPVAEPGTESPGTECPKCAAEAEDVERLTASEAAISRLTSAFEGRFPGKGHAINCEHYGRGCWIKADCCGKYYPCRRCHDANESHPIDRHATKYVGCIACGADEVPVGPNCTKCGVQFARYYCEPCRFYDDGDKDIYHCGKCGICRIGKGLDGPEADNFHCDRCNSCVPIRHAESHPCRSESLDSNCPVCKVYLKTCTSQVVFMRCGHAMHHKCFEEYTLGSYTCPICCKALTDMTAWYTALDDRIALEVLPPPYDTKKTEILCNDCEKRSVVKWHFVFHKCKYSECGGYNTRVLSYPNEQEAAVLDAKYSGSGDDDSASEAGGEVIDEEERARIAHEEVERSRERYAELYAQTEQRYKLNLTNGRVSKTSR